MPNFDKMTDKEALAYCSRHKRRFINSHDNHLLGDKNYQEVTIGVMLGTIKPNKLPSYGMNFKEDDEVQA